jgi:DNA (cytosine-5)-methyltransferase 3A
MKVLSLFDGISCGMVALERAGIPIESYYASEIEPHAIQISKKNHPEIIQLGDITQITSEMLDAVMPIDIVIGGSPCQDLSVYKFDRGEVTGLNGEKSGLFYHYVRILQYVKPKFFILENVPMEEQWKNKISELLGVEPIMINSNLLCAADRKRLYWTNIEGIQQPQDKGLVLKDIILSADEVPDKYWYNKPFTYNGDDCKVQCTLEMKGHRHMKEVYNLKGKCSTLTTCGGGNLQKKVYQDGKCRKLTPLEYERLQTLPDGYTEGVADSHRYNAIGNGWTVDVIAHILSFLPEEYKKQREVKEMELRIKEVTLPEQITFNYEELKQELTAKVEMYETLVYTDEQIQDAKKDKANLNKLKKALNDERIRREKEYMQPFNQFKAQINEIIGIIDKPVAVIDKQVKEYEEKQKQEKLDNITKFFNSTIHPEWLHLSQIMDAKWLNASVSMKSIQNEITERLEQIIRDSETLSNLPEFSFEATEVYKSTLDLGKALNEAHRLAEIAKKKAEYEAQQKAREEEQARKAAEVEAKKQEEPQPVEQGFMNPPVEEAPAKQWVKFQAYMTVDQAKELKKFFDDRQIEFKAI